MLKIYTDGACSGNPGVGGWAFIIPELNGYEHAGYVLDTTNNRMELTAVIEALKCAAHNCSDTCVEIITDSQYVVNTMTQGWQRKKNLDLWQELDKVVALFKLTVRWTWVKGHADNEYNQKCDELAVEAYKRAKQEESYRDAYKCARSCDEYYDTEIPLTNLSLRAAVTIAFTAYKRYTIGTSIYTILDCAALPGLYVIEKDYCTLIYHGTFEECVLRLKDIKDSNYYSG